VPGYKAFEKFIGKNFHNHFLHYVPLQPGEKILYESYHKNIHSVSKDWRKVPLFIVGEGGIVIPAMPRRKLGNNELWGERKMAKRHGILTKEIAEKLKAGLQKDTRYKNIAVKYDHGDKSALDSEDICQCTTYIGRSYGREATISGVDKYQQIENSTLSWR
jgi:hypothetical protein